LFKRVKKHLMSMSNNHNLISRINKVIDIANPLDLNLMNLARFLPVTIFI